MPRRARSAESASSSPATCSARAPFGAGCILEHGDGRWLRPGDEVELEVEGIGVLRNRVATA